jgi:hypothetical protein
MADFQLNSYISIFVFARIDLAFGCGYAGIADELHILCVRQARKKDKRYTQEKKLLHTNLQNEDTHSMPGGKPGKLYIHRGNRVIRLEDRQASI